MLADRGCDEAVREATEALLLPMSGKRLQSDSRNEVVCMCPAAAAAATIG